LNKKTFKINLLLLQDANISTLYNDYTYSDLAFGTTDELIKFERYTQFSQ